MRLIDADALLYELDVVPLTGDGGVDANDLDEIISQQPTIDAVPVIRCKECKYWNKNNYRCANVPCVVYRLEDDYCSYAERKEE